MHGKSIFIYVYMYSYNQYQLTLSHTHKVQESSVIAIQTGRKFSWAIQLSYRILVSFLAHMLEILQFFPIGSVQFSRCCVRLFVTPCIAARQASLSITNSWSSPKPTSIKWMMPSSHLILCRPLFLLPPIPLSIGIHSGNFHKPLVFVNSFHEWPWMTSG